MFLGRMSEEPDDPSARIAQALIAKGYDRLPKFDDSENGVQAMIEFAHCVDAYHRFRIRGATISSGCDLCCTSNASVNDGPRAVGWAVPGMPCGSARRGGRNLSGKLVPRDVRRNPPPIEGAEVRHCPQSLSTDARSAHVEAVGPRVRIDAFRVVCL